MSDPTPERVVRDALGEIRIPAGALYGPQTARAAAWTWSRHRMPLPLVHALGLIKACAARAHGDAGRLRPDIAQAIERAAREVADGRHDDQFVVDLYQTGSGTSTNMNANEVIATRARQLLAAAGAEQRDVHPNDQVNLAQSSNDVVPSALHVALLRLLHERLRPALTATIERFDRLADRHWPDLRDGRTHLMRATPVRFGQQFRGYAHLLSDVRARLDAQADAIAELPLGGTAVGTGVGCPRGFAAAVAAQLAAELGLPVREARQHLGVQGGLDAVSWLVAGLGVAAGTVHKIVGDLRWQASDAFGQLELPTMQPGSSIMPGKVNP
ncbi:MAG: aspartate ammonia-lyase, partial [Planctomycetes bacterium]|nr:aspartate ammonia-lyase [Planctomycetota bacterium]